LIRKPSAGTEEFNQKSGEKLPEKDGAGDEKAD
jgi:hypothetical protein